MFLKIKSSVKNLTKKNVQIHHLLCVKLGQYASFCHRLKQPKMGLSRVSIEKAKSLRKNFAFFQIFFQFFQFVLQKCEIRSANISEEKNTKILRKKYGREIINYEP